MSNITNQVSCDKEVKKISSSFLNHKKCTPKTEQKYATQVSGEFLNEYLKEKKYLIRLLRKVIVPILLILIQITVFVLISKEVLIISRRKHLLM